MARPNNTTAINEHVQGLRDAKAAFQALPEIARDHFNAATMVTVSEIARGAQARLLASPSIQTRNLYNAIGWAMNWKAGRGSAGVMNVSTTLSVNGRKVRVKGIVTAGKGGSAAIAHGATIDKPRRRAHFVEFGTKNMPAEPFMLPAAENETPRYLARCRQVGPEIERDMAAIGARLL